MSYTEGPWMAKGTRVYMGSKYICSAPCIGVHVDQTRLDGESWLAMRERIRPQIKAAEKEEIEVANLIAAAPELLEVLEDLFEMCNRQDDFNDDGDGYQLERCAAAIAKAKGQK